MKLPLIRNLTMLARLIDALSLDPRVRPEAIDALCQEWLLLAGGDCHV